MKENLLHPFFKNYKDAISLYSGCSTMGAYISRVSKIAKKIEEGNPVDFISDKTDLKDIANDFRGASFEGFCIDFFLKEFGILKEIGVRDPKQFAGKDWGVDIVGIGNNRKPWTGQCKSRVYDCKLTSDKDHLDNFVNQSWDIGVDRNDTENMMILTTGKEVDFRDMHEWNNKVRYIALNQSWGCFRCQKYQPQDPTNTFSFKSLLDDNHNFWDIAAERISLFNDNEKE